MINMVKIGSIALVALSLATPFIALAQGGSTQVQPVPVPPAADIPGLVTRIINFLFGLLLVVAALFVFYAAYLYLTAAGNEEMVKSARNYIIYAVVAIVVAFLSRTVIALVREILQVP